MSQKNQVRTGRKTTLFGKKRVFFQIRIVIFRDMRYISISKNEMKKQEGRNEISARALHIPKNIYTFVLVKSFFLIGVSLSLGTGLIKTNR